MATNDVDLSFELQFLAAALTLFSVTLVTFLAVIGSARKRWNLVVAFSFTSLIMMMVATGLREMELLRSYTISFLPVDRVKYALFTISSVLYSWSVFFQAWRITPFNRALVKVLLMLTIGLFTLLNLASFVLSEYTIIKSAISVNDPTLDIAAEFSRQAAPYFEILLPLFTLGIAGYLFVAYYLPRLRMFRLGGSISRFWSSGAGILIASELLGLLFPILSIFAIPLGIQFLIIAIKFYLFTVFLIITFYATNLKSELPNLQLIADPNNRLAAPLQGSLLSVPSTEPKHYATNFNNVQLAQPIQPASPLSPVQRNFSRQVQPELPYYNTDNRNYRENQPPRPTTPSWVREARINNGYDQPASYNYNSNTANRRKDIDRYSLEQPQQMYDPPIVKKDESQTKSTTTVGGISDYLVGLWGGKKPTESQPAAKPSPESPASTAVDAGSPWSKPRDYQQNDRERYPEYQNTYDNQRRHVDHGRPPTKRRPISFESQRYEPRSVNEDRKDIPKYTWNSKDANSRSNHNDPPVFAERSTSRSKGRNERPLNDVERYEREDAPVRRPRRNSTSQGRGTRDPSERRTRSASRRR